MCVVGGRAGGQAVGETDVPWDMVSKPGTSKVCNVGMRVAKIVFIDPGESLRKTGL